MLRRGCRNTPALIEWDSMPTRIKHKYVEVYGDPHKQVEGYSLRSFITTDYEANEFFANYLLADGRNLPTSKQIEYSTNASLLNAISRIVNDRSIMRKALGGNTRNIWPNIAATVSQLKAEFKHTLPDNHIRLKQRLEQYRKDGYPSMISGKWLNNNAAKVVDVQKQAALRSLLRKHNNFDNEQIRTMYNIIADKLGWDMITAGTIANYREKWAMETYSGRMGETAFDNARAMQVKRKAPSFPLYYWTSDGWDVELLYQKTEIDAKGNSRTTYHNRLTVVVILDPCCKYPVGYAIGTHETPELIKSALRNAVNHTRELFGNRHKVLQLQTDNYGKKTLLSIYEAVSDHFTPARVHNAKAKVIEPYFARLNKKYCQLMPNWSGFGIASGSSKQPNAEYLNKIRHSFPDETGCRMQIERFIEMERAGAYDKYIAAYHEMPGEDKKIITDQEYLYLLGESTGNTNRLQASGLVVTIDGVKREYDSFDPNFRRHSYVDWTVKYDPDQPETALAISEDGSLRFSLNEKYVQPMALRERKEEDTVQLKRVRDYNRTVKAEITSGMAEDYQVVEQMFASNPQLNGTLSKLILVDSNGQHKDNKSASRLKGAQKLLQKQATEDERRQEQSWKQKQDAYLDSKVNLDNYL